MIFQSKFNLDSTRGGNGRLLNLAEYGFQNTYTILHFGFLTILGGELRYCIEWSKVTAPTSKHFVTCFDHVRFSLLFSATVQYLPRES